MAIKPCLNQFNGGELSPWLGGRHDLPKYQYSAELLKNFIVLAEGGLKRRGGSHYVASVKQTDAVLLNIAPTPANAVVVMNGEEQRQLYAAYGDYIIYSVSCEGYQTQTGVHMVTENETLEIVLVSKTERRTLTINTVPDDADVYINNIEGKSLSLLANSLAEWQVGCPGYESQSGNLILRSDTSLNIKLSMYFTIVPIPADATVTMNGQTTNKIEVDVGDTVNWQVSRAGFETKSGQDIVQTSTIKSVNLTGIDYNIVQFESATPGTYTFEVAEDSMFEIEGTGAGSGGYWKTDWNGGSGAVYKGLVALAKGLYEIVIGSKGSTGKPPSSGGATTIKKDNVEILTLGGGIFGQADGPGKISKHFYAELSVIVSQNGTSLGKGNWRANANALYGTTYGFGGGRNGDGGNGYLKITYKGVYIHDS